MDEQSLRIRENLARVDARLAEIAAFQAKSDRYLDRVERCLKREARRDRERRKKLAGRLSKAATAADAKIAELAAAQLATEDKLQRLIDSQLGTNGTG